MKKLRKILGAFWFIHLMVFLGLFSLLGYLMTDVKILIFFIVLSYSGAICGSFIRVIDTIKK
ncbi:hypothetical protein K8R66_02555 [bacterium]|nr:hypothetical protein [bacterium]